MVVIGATATDVAAPSGSGTSTGANTGDVTIGTSNGLSLSGQVLSLQAATNSVPGALTAVDHTTLSTAVQPGGNIGAATATSINFGQTALNGYKEGLWTPVYSGTGLTQSGGSTAYTGTYTRIGNTVYCTLELIATGGNVAGASGASFYFTGLPYAVSVPNTCTGVTSGLSSLGNGLLYTNSRVFPPTWAAATDIIISFWYKTTAAF